MLDLNSLGALYGFYDSKDGYFKVYEAFDFGDSCDSVVIKFVGDFVNYEEAVESVGRIILVEHYGDIESDYLS